MVETGPCSAQINKSQVKNTGVKLPVLYNSLHVWCSVMHISTALIPSVNQQSHVTLTARLLSVSLFDTCTVLIDTQIASTLPLFFGRGLTAVDETQHVLQMFHIKSRPERDYALRAARKLLMLTRERGSSRNMAVCHRWIRYITVWICRTYSLEESVHCRLWSCYRADWEEST